MISADDLVHYLEGINASNRDVTQELTELQQSLENDPTDFINDIDTTKREYALFYKICYECGGDIEDYRCVDCGLDIFED